MRFWDSSAIVTLVIPQKFSDKSEEVIITDEEIVTWWATPAECWSAFARLAREGQLEDHDEVTAFARLKELSTSWHEVPPSEEVRLQARRVLRTHSLRAGDALQLAAALVWAGQTGDSYFVTYDKQLRAAATKEGFL